MATTRPHQLCVTFLICLTLSGILETATGFSSSITGSVPGKQRPPAGLCQKETSHVGRATQLRLLSTESASETMMTSNVFCNREISLKRIEAVGFDMDFTLAQYNTKFDLLAFDGALEKLVGLGYPEEVLSFTYDATRFKRGLVLDKRRGNIIKMDRYKYIRVAYHGSREMTTEERKATYIGGLNGVMPSFTGAEFKNLDTLFDLVDVVVFEQLIDLKDRLQATDEGTTIRQTYMKMYADVRKSVDLCHRDGVIKDRVAENPGEYILPDPQLFKMLAQFKADGNKKVFLLTNSLWDYTDVVMKFLYSSVADTGSWLDYFDLVVVGACKPAYMKDPNLPLFRINTEHHTLQNTDGVPDSPDQVAGFLANGKVFQGGHAYHLHQMLGITSGDRLLYVGDHMYSDILKSKRTLGWRTCLVIPELENELAMYGRHEGELIHLQQLADLREQTDRDIDALHVRAMNYADDDVISEGGEVDWKEELYAMIQKRKKVQRELKNAITNYHDTFHPIWGQLFKAGLMDSRFFKQVTDYACLYTTKASDLGSVSPYRFFNAETELSWKGLRDQR